MTSYSFAELWKYLNASPQSTDTQPTQFETDLKLANWVVVSAIKPNTTQPETQAFLRLLSDRPQLLRDKKVIAFAFGAPYYLDATDVSKLTAYYGMYSKSAPFIEVAARILFQDLFAAGAGALPVSVSGVGYDLTIATRPDPTQIIPLFIDSPSTSSRLANGTLEPTPAPLFRVGDVFPLRTGVIYDRNHNPVPDGTAVRFVFSVISESTGSNQTQIDTETIDGIARAVYRIDRPGLLEIHAASDEEARSNLLRLDITTGVSAGVTLVAPTPQPTETLVPTPTVTVTAVATPTIPPPIPPTVHFQDWFLALSIALAGAIAIAWFGIRMAIARWGLRWALCGVIGGMLSYNYLALNMPGSQALLGEYGTSGVLLVTITGVLIGWGVGIAWRQISAPRARSAGDRSPRERPATGPKSQSG
jgi:beta-N-acetylhexosaminidase